MIHPALISSLFRTEGQSRTQRSEGNHQQVVRPRISSCVTISRHGVSRGYFIYAWADVQRKRLHPLLQPENPAESVLQALAKTLISGDVDRRQRDLKGLQHTLTLGRCLRELD